MAASPLESAQEVGAQQLCKPPQCFRKGKKNIKTESLNIRGNFRNNVKQAMSWNWKKITKKTHSTNWLKTKRRGKSSILKCISFLHSQSQFFIALGMCQHAEKMKNNILPKGSWWQHATNHQQINNTNGFPLIWEHFWLIGPLKRLLRILLQWHFHTVRFCAQFQLYKRSILTHDKTPVELGI